MNMRPEDDFKKSLEKDFEIFPNVPDIQLDFDMKTIAFDSIVLMIRVEYVF